MISDLLLNTKISLLIAKSSSANDSNKRVTMQVPVAKMMDIIKGSVREFNKRQRDTASISKTFVLAGQNPWKDCNEEFKAHLDRHSELPLHGGCKSSVEGLENRMINCQEGLLLEGDEKGQVEGGAVTKEMWRSKRVTCETVRCGGYF